MGEVGCRLLERNPVRYGDSSGHKLSTSQGWMLMGYLAAPQHGMSREAGLAWGAVAGRRATINEKGNQWQRSDLGRINWERGFDSTIGKDGFFGYFFRENIYNNLFGKKYSKSNEGKFNKGLQAGLWACAALEDERRGGNLYQTCLFFSLAMQSYNNRRESRSSNWNLIKAKPLKINYENIITCAVLLQQIDEWTKLKRDPSDPNPTNTSNGEPFDEPNRLNGCATAGGDG